jgi:hypothetical protein
MSPPRATLITNAVGFIRASCSAPIMPVVSGVFGMWTVTKSLWRSTSSNESSSTCSCWARVGVTYGSYPTTRTPKARSRSAMSAPMRPRPTIPTVFSKSSVPV